MVELFELVPEGATNGTEYRAYISCSPQSRWVLVSKSDSEVVLSNKHTKINLAIEEFEKHWVKVKEK